LVLENGYLMFMDENYCVFGVYALGAMTPTSRRDWGICPNETGQRDTPAGSNTYSAKPFAMPGAGTE
jgi:hypothetical protein